MLKEALKEASRMFIGDEGLKRIRSREHGKRVFELEQKGVLTGDQTWKRINSSSHGLRAEAAMIGFYEKAASHRAETHRLTSSSSRW